MLPTGSMGEAECNLDLWSPSPMAQEPTFNLRQGQRHLQQLSRWPAMASVLQDFVDQKHAVDENGRQKYDEYPTLTEITWTDDIAPLVDQVATAIDQMLRTFPIVAFKAAEAVSEWIEGAAAPVPNLNQFFFEVYNTLHAPAGTADMLGLAQLAASIRALDRPLFALWVVTNRNFDGSKNTEKLAVALQAVHSGEELCENVLFNLRLHDEAFNMVESGSWADLQVLLNAMQSVCKSSSFTVPSPETDVEDAWDPS